MSTLHKETSRVSRWGSYSTDESERRFEYDETFVFITTGIKIYKRISWEGPGIYSILAASVEFYVNEFCMIELIGVFLFFQCFQLNAVLFDHRISQGQGDYKYLHDDKLIPWNSRLNDLITQVKITKLLKF